MIEFAEKIIECPNCGHQTSIDLDASNGDQDFYEECSACCSEIHCKLECDEEHDKVKVYVDADDEQYF